MRVQKQQQIRPRVHLSALRIVKDGLDGAHASKLYVTSVYWTVTTLSTVGYGDIFASTIAERTYCILVSIVAPSPETGSSFRCMDRFEGGEFQRSLEIGTMLHLRVSESKLTLTVDISEFIFFFSR